MDCPVCERNTKVINSRPSSDSIRRRRVCLECGYRFNTVEVDEDMHIREYIRAGKPLTPRRFSVEYDPVTDEVRIIKEEAEE